MLIFDAYSLQIYLHIVELNVLLETCLSTMARKRFPRHSPPFKKKAMRIFDGVLNVFTEQAVELTIQLPMIRGIIPFVWHNFIDYLQQRWG